MKRLVFSKSKNNLYSKFLILIIAITLIVYICLYLFYLNKDYFRITSNFNNYYIVPDDKEGEKIKYLDKKSINNKIDNNNYNLTDFNDLNYSIQIFSDSDYSKVVKYKENIVKKKGILLDLNHLFLFSITSEIGTEYFLTYKNFETKMVASSECNKLSFIIKRCLVINLNSKNL